LDLSSVVVRALTLFGPGELRTLRVEDADVFRVVVAVLGDRRNGGASASQMAQALNSLDTIELTSRGGRYDDEHAAMVVNYYAATVKELRGPLPGRLLCASDDSGHPPVLARCTRLEVLTEASLYTPAVWLGLSQLHTLRDVDLNKVPIAAITAAHPQGVPVCLPIPKYGIRSGFSVLYGPPAAAAGVPVQRVLAAAAVRNGCRSA
jgi:hypothetical protein